MLIQATEWLPDLGGYPNPGAVTVSGVYPASDGAYGPVAGLSTSLNALDATCQGAAGFRDSAGTAHNFACSATKLYHATASNTTWQNVSKAGGYSVPAGEFGEFTIFGDTAIFVDISDPPQSMNAKSGSVFANLSAGAPNARHAAVVKDFLMLGNTNDGVNGVKLQRLWWSAINDPTNFPTPGTSAAAAVQSDFQDIPGVQGQLQRIVPAVGTIDAALFFERAVWRGVYVGAPDIFAFYPANGVKGCFAPGSIALTEYGVIYLAPDGFYLFDGQYAVPIGYQKVDKTFYETVNTQFISRCTAVIDPAKKLYWIAFPSLSSTGLPDTLWVCNYASQSTLGSRGRWSQADPTAGVATSRRYEVLFRSTNFGYTVDSLDNTGYNVDTLPFSLDSPVWAGNEQESFSAFNGSHLFATFAGSNFAIAVDTNEVEPTPGKRSTVRGAIPLVTGDTASIALRTRSRQGDAVVTSNNSVAVNSFGFCPVLADARYFSGRITLPSANAMTLLKGFEIPDDYVSATGDG